MIKQFHSWVYNSWVYNFWEQTKILIWNDTCTPVFITVLFTTVKIQRQPMSIDRWMDICVCICMYIYIYIYIYGMCTKLFQSCPTFVILSIIALQLPLSMGFSRGEYWSGLPWPPPGHLPDPGIKPVSPALQADPFPLSHWGNLVYMDYYAFKIMKFCHLQQCGWT